MIKSELQPIISRTEAVCFFSPSSLWPLREPEGLVSMCSTPLYSRFGFPEPETCASESAEAEGEMRLALKYFLIQRTQGA